MDSYKRVKWHNWLDHSVKQIASRTFIDDKYVKNHTAAEVVIFLCSDKYTWDYENLPEKFYNKIERSMNFFDSLATILLWINSELYNKIEDKVLVKMAKHKENKLNITKLLAKIYQLSNKTEDVVNNIIDSYCSLEKVKSEIKEQTSDALDLSNEEDIKEDNNEDEIDNISYTPYQICRNESTLESTDGLNLLESLSNTFGILESKYLNIKDNFYKLMLENNKEFMLNNIFIHTSKTYMSDELLEMFKAYVYLVSKSKWWSLNKWIINWFDITDISDDEFIKSYIVQPWILSIKKSNMMWITRYSLSIN